MKFKKMLLTLAGISLMSVLTMFPWQVKAAENLEGESVYQIMVDRFYDGDSTNNATGEAFRYTENCEEDFRYMHGGDWEGVIQKIPYIKGLGYSGDLDLSVSDPQLWGVRIRPESSGLPPTMVTMSMTRTVPTGILDVRTRNRARQN